LGFKTENHLKHIGKQQSKLLFPVNSDPIFTGRFFG